MKRSDPILSTCWKTTQHDFCPYIKIFFLPYIRAFSFALFVRNTERVMPLTALCLNNVHFQQLNTMAHYIPMACCCCFNTKDVWFSMHGGHPITLTGSGPLEN